MGSSLSTPATGASGATTATSEDVYEEQLDAAKDEAVVPEEGTDVSDPADPTEPEETAPAETSAPANDVDEDDSYDPAVADNDTDVDVPVETADEATVEGDDYARREELLDWMRAQTQSAKQASKDAMKNGDAEGMNQAASDAMEVLNEAQAEVEVMEKKEAELDKQDKKQLAKFLQQMRDNTLTLKAMRGQLGQGRWQGLSEQKSKQFVKDLTQKIQESLRQKSDRETQRLNKQTEQKHSLWTELCKGAKHVVEKKNPGHEKKERLSDEEIESLAQEAYEDGYDGISSFKDLRPADRAAVRKTVKQMHLDAEKKEAAKAREAEKAEKARTTEESDAAAETHEENAGLKAPSQQHLKTVVASMREAGRLTKEQADKILKDMADRAVKTMAKGAKTMVARDDDEEHRAMFGEALEGLGRVFGQDEGDGGKVADEDKPQFLAFFRNTTMGLKTALERGTMRALKKAGQTLQVNADATYQGETVEEGILAYNRALGNSTPMEENVGGLHANLWESQKDRDELLAARLQATDPEKRVG